MKIEQGPPKPAFPPITIILETHQEAEAFKLMGNVAQGVVYGVVRETTSYHITADRKKAILKVLNEIWTSAPFQSLDITGT